MSANLHISPWLIPVDLEGGGGGGGGGGVQSVVAGTGITVDNTDPQNPIVSATGGGGLPAITSDVTLNVPTDFPTINDALDWVRERVRLNGANVTIFVEDGTTLAESVVLTNECLDYVTLSFGENVTFDADAAPPTPLGVPAYLYADNAKISVLNGAINSINKVGATAELIVAINSNVRVDNVVCDGFDGILFAKNSDIFCNRLIATNCVSAVTAIATKFFLDNSQLHSAQECVYASLGSDIQITSSASPVALVAGDVSVFFIENSALSVVQTSGLITIEQGQSDYVIECNNSSVDINAQSLTTGSRIAIFKNAYSQLSVEINFLDMATNTPDLLMADAGTSVVGVSNVTGTSSGYVCNVNQAAIFQKRLINDLTVYFTGGYSQTPNVPTADGLIFA